MTEQDARVDSAVTGHDAAVEELRIFRSMLQGVLVKVIVLYLCVALLCCIHTYCSDAVACSKSTMRLDTV
jgi:hypothetical protein